MHPGEQKADSGHSEVQVTDPLSHASRSFPGCPQLPLFPKQPFTWPAGVTESASPSLLCREGSKLEAQRCAAWECGSYAVSLAWTGTGSSLCNRETEGQGYTGAKNSTIETISSSSSQPWQHLELLTFQTSQCLGRIPGMLMSGVWGWPGCWCISKPSQVTRKYHQWGESLIQFNVSLLCRRGN